jgi:FemAB-related protein (PEP-CTERM system-associated)
MRTQQQLKTVIAAPPVGHVGVTVSEDVTGEEWDAFVLSYPGSSVDHLWPWRQIVQDVFRHQPAYLAARRGTDVVGVLPLIRFHSRLFGRFIVSLPFLNYGGVLASDPGVIKALVDHARELALRFDASHIELRHHERQLPELPYRQHKLALRRALPGNPEELWSTIDRKVRNQVRKAQKDGLTTAIGGAELVDQFYDVFARNMRDLGTPVYPKRLFSETLRHFPDAAQVYTVRSGNVTVASAIAIRHGDTVLVPWASSLREYRHQCPNMLLYWTMLERASTAGARVFDFGRSSPDSGTHHFKVQWGAQATPLHWEYVLLTRQTPPDHGPRNPKFAAAISAWQKLPLWFTNSAGPMIVRNIP